MTASRHARRRKKRGGRPRDHLAKREPNGRAQRSAKESADEARRTALTARIRHGWAKDLRDAEDPRCMSFLGRLERSGEITPGQHDAAKLMRQRWDNWLRAIGARRPDAAPSPTGPGELSPDDALRWRREWLDTEQAARRTGRHQVMAQVIIDNCATRHVSSLRTGLEKMRIFFQIKY